MFSHGRRTPLASEEFEESYFKEHKPPEEYNSFEELERRFVRSEKKKKEKGKRLLLSSCQN